MVVAAEPESLTGGRTTGFARGHARRELERDAQYHRREWQVYMMVAAEYDAIQQLRDNLAVAGEHGSE